MDSVGVKPPGGAQRWHTNTLRGILSNPTYIGMRNHRGSGRTKGNWPPLVDELLWADVQAVRLAHAPVRRPPERGKFPWTGLLRCAHCGGTMYGSMANGKYPQYKCVPGCVSMSERLIEKALRGFALRVGVGVLETALESGGHDEPAGDSAAQELGILRERRQEAARMFAEGVLDASDYRAIVEQLKAQEAALERAPDRREKTSRLVEAVADALANPEDYWEKAGSLLRRRLVEVAADAVVIAKKGSEPRVSVHLRQSSGDEVLTPEDWQAA